MSGAVKVVLGLAVVLLVGAGALLLLEQDSGAQPGQGAALRLGDADAGARTQLPAADEGEVSRLTAQSPGVTALDGTPASPDGSLDPAAASAEPPPGPRALLTGRAVDTAGRPVAQARVVFHAPGGVFLARRLDPEAVVPADPETLTDVDGRFAFEVDVVEHDSDDELPGLLGGGGHGQLALVHAAFQTGMHDCPRLVEGTLDMGTLVLEPGSRVSGRVVDQNGRPIAGAEVSGRNLAAQTGRLTGGFLGMLAGRVAEEHGSSTSGPDGRFEVTGLAPGAAEITASADGRQLGVVEGLELAPHQVLDVGDVILGAGESIAGWVVDDQGRPLAGASLRVSSMARLVLNSMDDMPSRRLGNAIRVHAESDGDGWFELTGLSPGQYTLHVRAEGHGRLDRENVSTGTDDLRLVVSPLGNLLITLVDESDSEPVDGADLRARPGPTGGFSLRGERLPVLSGEAALAAAGEAAGKATAAGLYLVQDVPAQGASVEVRAEGFAALEQDSAPVPSGGTARMIAMLLPESVLSGTVIDSLGAPVADARVSVSAWSPPQGPGGFVDGDVEIRREVRRSIGGGGSGPDWRKVRADDQGRFEVRGVPAGAWELEAVAEGFSRSEPVVAKLERGERRDDLVLTTPVAGSLAGRVIERDGTPVSGADVVVKALEQSSDLQSELASSLLGLDLAGNNATTDGKGEFLVQGLLPGRYDVRLARRQGLSMGNAMILMGGPQGSSGPDDGVEVDVAARERAWVELVRPPTATLGGQVLAGGRPVEGVSVSLDPAGALLPFGGTRTETDRFGRFEFTGVEPGKFDLSAVAPGAAIPVEHTVELAGGATATQDLIFSGATVAGRVLDAESGQGVGGVTINMVPVKPGSGGGIGGGNATMAFSFVSTGPGGSNGMQMDIGGGALSRVRSAPDGRYEVLWVEPGEYTMTVEGGGVVSTDHGPISVPDETLVDGVDIKAPRGAVLSGMVTSLETGMPLTGTPVMLVSVDGGEREMSMAEEGRYRFEGLEAGEYTVQVMGSGFGGAPLASDVVLLEAGEERLLDLAAAEDAGAGGGGPMTITIGG